MARTVEQLKAITDKWLAERLAVIGQDPDYQADDPRARVRRQNAIDRAKAEAANALLVAIREGW
jgi:hypothetical protein